jgi:hypothetical protein
MRPELPHRMNRDAVTVITDSDLALRLAVAALPAEAQALAGDPRVTVTTWDDPCVPEDLRWMKAARPGFGRKQPSVCRHDDEAGAFLLVIGEVEDLGHEIIHVAQALADEAANLAAFDQVAADGGRLVAAARDAVRDGRHPSEHRDLTWCRNAAHPRNDTLPVAGQQDHGLITTFDLHAMVHPVAATRDLGERLGLDRHATLAATFAHYLAQNGAVRARSSHVIECVAYRYERDIAALAPLFSAALASRAA